MIEYSYEIITDFHPSEVYSIKRYKKVKTAESYALMRAFRIGNYLLDEVNFMIIRIYQCYGREKTFLHSIKIEKHNNKFIFVRSFSFQKKARNG